ncbi:pantoate--beta-alanine ligase [Candidatus Tenderia electrophaga]|jgi:pantoate--beta-alanine ligase|uniref:Pantothenate synthetase n=1 Tax=Candidatus Tenderia electrophaga TaxID=1748243 RepID=A0A0S2TBB3_9GAMM|nr:pantoate--beta-alanine ligase [Candidatus Tenderia electrophaga]
MQMLETLAALRSQLQAWRQAGDGIAFVPTMGNLHAGHLALVEQARQHGQRLVVSIFVNPMQFGPNEDFECYPRTLARDRDTLEAAAVDVLFTPRLEAVYPTGPARTSRVEVPGLSEPLEGERRPGHFAGVATVVAKLFNMVQPQAALFGEKDFQQLLVIRRMAADLCFPVEIIAVPTVRAADGLALSSRNAYLNETERALAPGLYQTLRRAADSLLQGERDFEGLQRAGLKALNAAGFDAEYFAIRGIDDLGPPDAQTREVVILAAARLGATRLIDNVRQVLVK